MADWLNTPALQGLEKGLDASSLRQRVLADNVANVDTPGFKRSDVDFPTIMAEAIKGNGAQSLPLKATSERHLPGLAVRSAAIVQDSSTTMRNDGNNVDIDREMSNVAKNNLYYNALTTSLSTQIAQLRTVIKGE